MAHWYVWSRVLFVSVSGFLYGYDVGSINGVKDMEGYRRTLNISYNSVDGINGTESCDPRDNVETAAILGLIVSLLSAASLAGALVAGVLSDVAGRKPAVIIGASLVSIGGMLHIAALNLWMVLLSRVVSGLGLGVLYQVTPLYVAEISPEKLRGRLLSFLNVFATTGTLMGHVANLVVKRFSFGWRISVGAPFVIGTLLALGMLLLPRSPRWLVKKHKDERALKILTKIYKDQDRAQTQLEEIQSTVSSTKEPFMQTLKYILQWKILRRVLLGFFMFIIGRFTGINFIGYFSVSIFCGIGLPGYILSVVVGIVGVTAVLLGTTIIDKLGRKPVLLIGACLVLVSHFMSATLILGYDLEGQAVDGFSVSQNVAGYFVLVAVCVFICGASIAIGSVPWILIGEIFPLRGRGVMISICNTGFWLGIIVVNQVSEVLVKSPLRISGTLYLFGVITFIFLLYVLLLLPETKGQSLEKIEELFSKPWLERTNVVYYLRCACFLELLPRKKGSKSYRVLDHEQDELSSQSSSSRSGSADNLSGENVELEDFGGAGRNGPHSSTSSLLTEL